MNTGSPKRIVKRSMDVVGLMIVLPLVLMYRIQLILSRGSDTAIQSYSQLLSLVPGTVGVVLRRAFFRVTLVDCAADCSLGFGTLIVTPQVAVGSGTYIGDYCNISHSSIGRDVLIGSHVHILSGRNIHSFASIDLPIRMQGGRVDPISVGNDVWIGNAAVVMADVGDHAVVAAGTVVVRPIASYAIVGGNPARVLGTRTAGTSPLVTPAAQ